MSPLYYSGDFLLPDHPMSIKVLINAIGQHLIADVKQVENSETNEVLAYWLREPRLISYSADDQGQLSDSFRQHLQLLVSPLSTVSVPTISFPSWMPVRMSWKHTVPLPSRLWKMPSLPKLK